MEPLSLLVLCATLLLSFLIAWALINPFFERAAALGEVSEFVAAAETTSDLSQRKELLLSELEELEQDFKDGAIDEASYNETKNLLLGELAPFFSA